MAYDEVLGEVGKAKKAYAQYRDFVRAGAEVPPESPLARALEGLLLGAEKFIGGVKRLVSGKGRSRDLPQLDRLRKEVDFRKICAAVCKEYDVERSSLGKKGQHGNEARKAAIYLGREKYGIPAAEVGAGTGGLSPSAVTSAVARVRAELRKYPDLSPQLDRVREQIGSLVGVRPHAVPQVATAWMCPKAKYVGLTPYFRGRHSRQRFGMT